MYHMNAINYCEGCRTYIYAGYTGAVCRGAKYNGTGKCPCTDCIVKMMCIQTCHVYKSFTITKRRESIPSR